MFDQFLLVLGPECISDRTPVRDLNRNVSDAVVALDEAPPPAYEMLESEAKTSHIFKVVRSARTISESPKKQPEKLTETREPAREFSTSYESNTFKIVALVAFQNILLLTRIAKSKVDFARDQDFKSTKPYRKPKSSITQGKLVEVLHTLIDEKPEMWTSSAREGAKACLEIITEDSENNVEKAFGALKEVYNLHRLALSEMGGTLYAAVDLVKKVSADDIGTVDGHGTFQLTSTRENKFIITWPALHGESFISAVMDVARTLRTTDKIQRFNEFLAFHFAYNEMRSEGPVKAKRFLGTVGFRQHSQTYVSLTDPGDGHIFGTTRYSRWMTGAIVHNEYLERPKGSSAADVEPYRSPHYFSFSCVRLHVGAQAPMTVYIGRFDKSGNAKFEDKLVKAVNLACAAMHPFFNLGAAECKISMDGLTTSEALTYMKALSHRDNVQRSPLQYLSAAFNINPASGSITDDTHEPPTKLEKIDIFLRGIQLAAEGGFDKVTFDGAADGYPSKPLLAQISFRDAVKIVHEAHSVGLVTYMSAGFVFKNIKDAVYTGVDGIGLGGTQILRLGDRVTGMHGPYTEENIDRIKVERDDAEKSTRGRGALLLARLDHMHFEGSSTEAEDSLREPLYAALQNEEVKKIRGILDEEPARNVMGLLDDGEQPYLSRARRILRSKTPGLCRGNKDEALWGRFVEMLNKSVDLEAEDKLFNQYRESLWTKLRVSYRTMIGEENKQFQGEPRY